MRKSFSMDYHQNTHSNDSESFELPVMNEKNNCSPKNKNINNISILNCELNNQTKEKKINDSVTACPNHKRNCSVIKHDIGEHNNHLFNTNSNADNLILPNSPAKIYSLHSENSSKKELNFNNSFIPFTYLTNKISTESFTLFEFKHSIYDFFASSSFLLIHDHKKFILYKYKIDSKLTLIKIRNIHNHLFNFLSVVIDQKILYLLMNVFISLQNMKYNNILNEMEKILLKLNIMQISDWWFDSHFIWLKDKSGRIKKYTYDHSIAENNKNEQIKHDKIVDETLRNQTMEITAKQQKYQKKTANISKNDIEKKAHLSQLSKSINLSKTDNVNINTANESIITFDIQNNQFYIKYLNRTFHEIVHLEQNVLKYQIIGNKVFIMGEKGMCVLSFQ